MMVENLIQLPEFLDMLQNLQKKKKISDSRNEDNKAIAV